MADMPKQLPREVEDALLEEACRQWYAFIQEDADRSDGVGFAHFCRTLSEQLLNDKDFMENFKTDKVIQFVDSKDHPLFTVPDWGNIILTDLDGTRSTLPCRYIDEYHARIGDEVVGLCQFAELQEQRGAVYAPERPSETDICDTYEIYHIKNLDGIPYGFFAHTARDKLRPADYAKVYAGVLAPGVTLEDICAKHSQDQRLRGGETRSMRVGDIVVLTQGGSRRAFYTDIVDFKEVKEFLQPEQARGRRKKSERGGEAR